MRHVDYAISVARSANALGFHFGAVIFRGKDIISTGWCQCKTHPAQARYMQYAPKWKRRNSFLHAEMHALIVARKEARGNDMIIARIANDQLRPSHPCDACMTAVTVAGIRRIWFWNGYEWLSKEIES